MNRFKLEEYRNATPEDKLVADHQEMVEKLLKPGNEIKNSLLPSTCSQLHCAIGISSEAGELLDAFKKIAIYNKPMDRANVVEELGDLEFYMEALRQQTQITREETLTANIHKLSKGDKARYKEGYSDKAAIERADKT